MSNKLLEKSREIDWERMKRLCQSKINTQLWIWWVMEVKSDTVKSNIAYEPGMLGSWIKVNWKWSNRRWQEWILTLVISEWKWMWTGKFKAYEHYVQYCEQESLTQIGVPLIVSKRAWNSELGYNLKKKKKKTKWSWFISKANIQHHSNPSLWPNH